MRSRPALLVVCLLVTALAATPLAARDLRHPVPTSASWLEEMTGWVASLWDLLTGEVEPAHKNPKSLELPPPSGRAGEGDTQPGGSCIDPNGVMGSGVSCS